MSKRIREAGLMDIEDDSDDASQLPRDRYSRQRLTGTWCGRQPRAKKVRRQAPPKVREPPKKISVGIDFGTTYSGIAFLKVAEADANDVDPVQQWPGLPTMERLDKVPSRISFPEKNNLRGENVDSKWGYEVLPSHKSYSWFKLLLDSNAAQTRFDNAALSGQIKKGLMELPQNMDAEDLVTAYLKHLHDHTMLKLYQSYSEEEVDECKLEFWFTYPATWEESAKGATRNAALAAGFSQRRRGDQLYMITEPEAAAIAIMTVPAPKNPDTYKHGTNILVVDMGGGTVDLQCLQIDSIDPPRLNEVIAGIGGKSGSASIDSEFCKWMETTFGDCYTRLPPEKTGPGSRLMKEFETCKKAFDGTNLDKTLELNFPLLGTELRKAKRKSEAYEFGENHVLLTGHDFARMFQPVLDSTFALINDQRNSLEKECHDPIRVICLCGGLGESEYVWSKFREYIRETLEGSCRLVRDQRPWSSVVRGACMRGLGSQVVLTKKSKFWYGIGVHRAFEEGVDDEADAFVDAFGQKRARGYIDWVVKKNQKFTRNLRAQSNIWEAIRSDWDDERKQFAWRLYSCPDNEAPIRSSDSRVFEQGVISLDLRDEYPQDNEEAGATNVQRAKFKVTVKLGNEKGVLVVEARHDGQTVGTAQIDYARTHVRRPVVRDTGSG